MSKSKEISTAEALKFFRGQSITVQTATPVKLKGADGTERLGYKVEDKALAAGHVMAAREYEDRVVIATIDGRKHEAAKSGRAEATA